MSSLTRLPSPPEDAIELEQWRRDFVAFEELSLKERLNEEARTLFFTLVGVSILAGLVVPSLADAFGWTWIEGSLSKLLSVVQAVALLILAVGAVIWTLLQVQRRRDLLEISALHRRRLGLEDEVKRR